MTVLNNNGTTEFSIDTVTPEITVEQIMVSADRRSTEKAPLTDAERIRRVVIPAGHWGSISAAQNLHDSPALAALVTKGLQAIACARLKDYLQEQPLARTVAAADYTVSSLLAWNQETSKQGNVIPFSRDDLVAWYPTSATFTKYASKGKAIADAVGADLYKLAAKNHGIKDADKARRIMAWLDTAVAANDSTAAALVERLADIITNMESKKDNSKIDTNTID